MLPPLKSPSSYSLCWAGTRCTLPSLSVSWEAGLEGSHTARFPFVLQVLRWPYGSSPSRDPGSRRSHQKPLAQTAAPSEGRARVMVQPAVLLISQFAVFKSHKEDKLPIFKKNS